VPLAYEIRKPLEIPDDAYNSDDIAAIVVTGGRYGGQWYLSAIPMHGSSQGESVGEIFTNADDRPDMAVDTAYVWVAGVCMTSGVKLAHFQNKNSEYGPDEAPYFAGALFLIDRRVPQPAPYSARAASA
jgi:hypothetical protein